MKKLIGLTFALVFATFAGPQAFAGEAMVRICHVSDGHVENRSSVGQEKTIEVADAEDAVYGHSSAGHYDCDDGGAATGNNSSLTDGADFSRPGKKCDCTL